MVVAHAAGIELMLVWTIDVVRFVSFANSDHGLLETLADTAMFKLLNLTFPALEGLERDRYRRAVVDFVSRESVNVIHWPTSECTVRGRVEVFRTFEFADAWVAISEVGSSMVYGNDVVIDRTITLVEDESLLEQVAEGEFRHAEHDHRGLFADKPVTPDHRTLLDQV